MFDRFLIDWFKMKFENYCFLIIVFWTNKNFLCSTHYGVVVRWLFTSPSYATLTEGYAHLTPPEFYRLH